MTSAVLQGLAILCADGAFVAALACSGAHGDARALRIKAATAGIMLASGAVCLIGARLS